MHHTQVGDIVIFLKLACFTVLSVVLLDNFLFLYTQQYYWLL